MVLRSDLGDLSLPSLAKLRTELEGCYCCATLQKETPKYQGHKGDPGVIPGTCGVGGEKAQVILVWVKAPGVGNASHPQGLGVMRVRP
jgi:hypothetical protein